MIATPAVANDLNNVATTTTIKNCCCDYDRITLVNTGTTALTVGANPTLFVKRIAQKKMIIMGHEMDMRICNLKDILIQKSLRAKS